MKKEEVSSHLFIHFPQMTLKGRSTKGNANRVERPPIKVLLTIRIPELVLIMNEPDPSWPYSFIGSFYSPTYYLPITLMLSR